MPLSYETVVNADLSALAKAVGKWRVLPEELSGISDAFRSTITRKLSKRDWDGRSAEVGRGNFDKVSNEIDGASKEARAIHRLLKSALENLETIKKKLEKISTDVAESTHLSLNKATGQVLFNSPEKNFEQRQVIQKHLRETISEYNTQINTLLNQATEVDTALNWALMQDRNGQKPGFNARTYDSVEVASKSRDEARREVTEARKILEKRNEASNKEITRLNSIMLNRQGDPYFSEKIATGIGAKRLLVHWEAISNDPDMGDSRSKLVAKLQRSLGSVLATATASNSDAMGKWKKDVIELGGKRVDAKADNTSPSRPPYNFQVMSALMRNGQYDPDFLTSYGKKLLEFDREVDRDIWMPEREEIRLNFEGADKGADPVTGFMQALANNPDAAKGVLEKNDDLRYLVKDRDWLQDPVDGVDKDKGYGYDELGRAIESATLGVPWNEDGLKRDRTSADIAREVMKIVGEDVHRKNEQLLHDRPGLADNLARMGAGYIDDLTKATAPTGGMNNPRMLESGIYDTGDGQIGGLSHDVARDFLVEAGKHGHAYEILSNSQHVYTASIMESNAGDMKRVKAALDSGAYNMGLLAASRNEYLDYLNSESAEKSEKEQEKSSSWAQWSLTEGLSAVNSSLGAGAGAAVGGAIAGPPGAAVGAVALPVAGDLAISAVGHHMDLGEEGEKVSNAGIHSAKIRDQVALRLHEIESAYVGNHNAGDGIASGSSDKSDKGWQTAEGMLRSFRE